MGSSGTPSNLKGTKPGLKSVVVVTVVVTTFHVDDVRVNGLRAYHGSKRHRLSLPCRERATWCVQLSETKVR